MWKYLLICSLVLIIGCSDQKDHQSSDMPVFTVWAHAGQAAEREVLEQQVSRFNSLQSEIQVQLTFIPEQSYNAQVQAAAVAGELPDMLEFDGPFLYNYVWQGHLEPLDNLLSTKLQEELLPSIHKQGYYLGKFYAVGTFDSGLGLYARRSELKASAVRIPTGPGDAWTDDEFAIVLAALASHDPDGKVLDLKLNYSGEWFTYAFSPLLQSAGGDLIDRSDYQSAEGILNSPQSVGAMKVLQNWFTRGYIDSNLDDAAFVSGRVALSWAGHWEYARYAEALGNDLVLLPLPDLGKGSRTGQGSWVWGITKHSKNPQAVVGLLEFLLQPNEVLVMAAANGAVPATRAAIARSTLYGDKGPLQLFSRQLQAGYSVPRPQTPAYPVITSAFQQAFIDIRNGGDIQNAMDKAAAEIDQDIRDNRGYPPSD
ncbi:MAG: extracellular solute-binding protein [Candidatus Thiodiazotropha taylori]|nr:extracellular solute-binding protein [Shewanella sp.]MCG7923908.1 extracellular solute-binding protein [Candidatus Thiodiazotropha taylori]MCG7933878.1 extracellular solute-binding protein [Candidatus Thiodiazotropha taylori]MCG7972689.1 extracellular solute-binding protein [Candidatus Thiodiazotropha taylori]